MERKPLAPGDPITSYVPLWGQWEPVAFLGAGTFGRVYSIRRSDAIMESECAVKMIALPRDEDAFKKRAGSSTNYAEVARAFQDDFELLRKEVVEMSKFSGAPHFVHYYDHMVKEKTLWIDGKEVPQWVLFIRMELMTSLTEWLKTHESTPEIVRKVGMDICVALEEMERQSVLHRDIKEENIFVNRQGDFCLGDFGTARVGAETARGTRAGTPLWMAPEISNNSPYNQQADQYSLGIQLYKMMNRGRLPFEPLEHFPSTNEQFEAFTRRTMRGEKIPPPAEGPSWLAAVVLKACEYSPKQRYPNARSFYLALEQGETTRRSGVPRFVYVLLISLIAIILAAVAAVVLFAGPDIPTEEGQALPSPEMGTAATEAVSAPPPDATAEASATVEPTTPVAQSTPLFAPTAETGVTSQVQAALAGRLSESTAPAPTISPVPTPIVSPTPSATQAAFSAVPLSVRDIPDFYRQMDGGQYFFSFEDREGAVHYRLHGLYMGDGPAFFASDVEGKVLGAQGMIEPEEDRETYLDGFEAQVPENIPEHYRLERDTAGTDGLVWTYEDNQGATQYRVYGSMNREAAAFYPSDPAGNIQPDEAPVNLQEELAALPTPTPVPTPVPNPESTLVPTQEPTLEPAPEPTLELIPEPVPLVADLTGGLAALMDGGFAAYDGQRYYVYGYKGQKHIMAYDENMQYLTTLVQDAVFFTLYQGKLYYASVSQQNSKKDYGCLFRFDMTTGQTEKLTAKPITGYTLYGEHVYYGLDGRKGIYQANLDGSDAAVLVNGSIDDTKNVFRIQAYDDWLYFGNSEDGHKLYAYSLATGEMHRMTDEGIYQFTLVAYKGTPVILYSVYAKDSEGGVPMRAVDLSGAAVPGLSEEMLWVNTHHFAIGGDYLYFCDVSTGCDIKRMHLGSFEREHFAGGIRSTRIFVFGNWLFTADDNTVPYAVRLSDGEMRNIKQ